MKTAMAKIGVMVIICLAASPLSAGNLETAVQNCIWCHGTSGRVLQRRRD